MPESTDKENYELQTTIFCLSDWPREPVDALLFFGRARGDDNETIFKLAAEVFHSGLVKQVLINGSDGQRENGTTPEVWTGKVEWTRRLKALGVQRVHHFEPAWNTKDEAEKMIKYARGQDWKTASILAQPHQLLRCLASLIKAMERENYHMKIYCIAPRICSWFEDTAGSQGKKRMARHKHIAEEYSRITKYAGNGDIATLLTLTNSLY